MGKGRVAILVMSAVVFLTAGFVIGQMVQAVGTIPGTADDPLVAKSYVEEAVAEQVEDLQDTIAALEDKVAALEAQLDGRPAPAPVVTSPAPDDSGNDNNDDSSSDDNDSSAVSGKTMTVIAESCNVRSGPGTSYAKVITLLMGDQGTVLGEENGWYRVKTNAGQEGWVANWLVELE